MIEVSLFKRLHATPGDITLSVDFYVKGGSLLTLYGKSGAGKTTILKMLAGLTNPDRGQIIVNDEIWYDIQKKINLTPQKRKIGFVFQDYSLFPNMSVMENLIFALPKGKDKKIIKDLIEIVDLGNFRSRNPNTLSGGQRQRVALARTLVQRPEILLLDEPLSALDEEMRIKLQQYILRVHKEFNLTTILISHHISEIVKMSDYLIELDEGKIINKGIPKEIYTNFSKIEDLEIIGEIISVEYSDEISHILVLVGENLIHVPIGKKDTKKYITGDKVAISSTLSEFAIQKVIGN